MSSTTTLLAAATQLLSYGLLFVQNVPTTETSSERAEILKLVARFGRVRDTFYGKTWDVQSRGSAARNAAYTDLSLGLHSDLAYFESPPRYQVLHTLRNRGVRGGESIFSDGFRAAGELRRREGGDGEGWKALTREDVAFWYVNDNHHMYRERPTIELAPSPSSSSPSTPSSPSPSTPSPPSEPPIAYINYAPPFQAPLPLSSLSNPAFLRAFQEFSRLLTDGEGLFRYRMEEGDAVLFDNRRVLHGREGFENASGRGSASAGASGCASAGGKEGDGEGKEWRVEDGEREGTRWLKGCYMEAEGVLDTLNVLKDRLGGGV